MNRSTDLLFVPAAAVQVGDTVIDLLGERRSVTAREVEFSSGVALTTFSLARSASSPVLGFTVEGIVQVDANAPILSGELWAWLTFSGGEPATEFDAQARQRWTPQDTVPADVEVL